MFQLPHSHFHVIPHQNSKNQLAQVLPEMCRAAGFASQDVVYVCFWYNSKFCFSIFVQRTQLIFEVIIHLTSSALTSTRRKTRLLGSKKIQISSLALTTFSSILHWPFRNSLKYSHFLGRRRVCSSNNRSILSKLLFRGQIQTVAIRDQLLKIRHLNGEFEWIYEAKYPQIRSF